jgi:hypothetical protein
VIEICRALHNLRLNHVLWKSSISISVKFIGHYMSLVVRRMLVCGDDWLSPYDRNAAHCGGKA